MGRRTTKLDLNSALAEADWPSPFWAGGEKQLLEWRGEPTKYGEGYIVHFQAALVRPAGSCGELAEVGRPLPLVFYFAGLGLSGLEAFSAQGLARKAQGPCILVAPLRPKGKWWVLDDDGEWGWCDGELLSDDARSLCIFVRSICCTAHYAHPAIDAERPRALGFSAGAYALTELLAHGGPRPLFWQVALGGLHGHGQADTSEVQGKERLQRQAGWIVGKFEAYLERLGGHAGVPGGIFCFHHPLDRTCPLKHAVPIMDVMSHRQSDLGLPPVSFQRVEALDLVDDAMRRSYHCYQDVAFLSPAFLSHFLDTADPTPEARARVCLVPAGAVARRCRRSRSRSRSKERAVEAAAPPAPPAPAPAGRLRRWGPRRGGPGPAGPACGEGAEAPPAPRGAAAAVG